MSSNSPKDYLASIIHFGKDFSWQKILVVHHSRRLADFAKHLSLFLIKFELVQFPLINLYKSIFVIFFFSIRACALIRSPVIHPQSSVS